MKKKIFGLVALLLVLSLSMPMAAMAVVVDSISLTPATDQNVINMLHTVTAKATASGAPVSGMLVNFDVISGPNDDEAGSDVTDANGEATFTYTGDEGCGTDTIEAEWGDYTLSTTATKLWLYDKFSGGGKIIQEVGNKKKDYPKITWGGWAGYDCGGPVGEFEVTFHNVSNNSLDKTKFVSYFVTQLSYADYSGTNCPDADPPPSDANFAQVRLFGERQDEDGDFIAYGTIVINGMDNGEPGNVDDDTAASDGIRFILYSGGSRIYDSFTGFGGDFLPDQGGTCLDGANVRHELDSGNLQIVVPPDMDG